AGMLVSTMRELSNATPAEAGSSRAGLLATFCKFIATNEKLALGSDPPKFLTSVRRQPCLPRENNVSAASRFPHRNIGTKRICGCFQVVRRRKGHDRTSQTSNAQGCRTQGQIQDVAATLVTTRDARE